MNKTALDTWYIKRNTIWEGYLAAVFVDRQWPSVWRRDAVAVAVDAVHQSVMPAGPTGVQHRVLKRTHQRQRARETQLPPSSERIKYHQKKKIHII